VIALEGVTGVLRALHSLSAEERRVVVLHHLQDMSVAQIAAHTARPASAVQADLDRGHARLARCLRTDQLVSATPG
jgi:RNA polymerase sigma-70 factor (ECF subfamily)